MRSLGFAQRRQRLGPAPARWIRGRTGRGRGRTTGHLPGLHRSTGRGRHNSGGNLPLQLFQPLQSCGIGSIGRGQQHPGTHDLEQQPRRRG
ncbi:hypothetical protein, partial [Nocardia carnea]|uniref:hypothetical protein n=1 Tax=Nocardia carnea TaxID=37328 RepID=UPI002458D7D3